MDEIQELTEVFKALSDPTRLRLVKLLRDHEGALCVNALAHRLDVTQSAVSQHLRVLRQAHLVVSDRHGPSVHYVLNQEKFTHHKALLKDILGNEFA
jgi:DNA-binding transcriptional ArsR family regulator